MTLAFEESIEDMPLDGRPLKNSAYDRCIGVKDPQNPADVDWTPISGISHAVRPLRLYDD